MASPRIRREVAWIGISLGAPFALWYLMNLSVVFASDAYWEDMQSTAQIIRESFGPAAKVFAWLTLARFAYYLVREQPLSRWLLSRPLET